MSGIISGGDKNRHTSGSISSIILTRRMARGVIGVHMAPPTGRPSRLFEECVEMADLVMEFA